MPRLALEQRLLAQVLLAETARLVGLHWRECARGRHARLRRLRTDVAQHELAGGLLRCGIDLLERRTLRVARHGLKARRTDQVAGRALDDLAAVLLKSNALLGRQTHLVVRP